MTSRLHLPALSVHPENQYLDLMRDVLAQPVTRQTRNDDATKSIFGRQIRFDLEDGFPILTTKRVFWTGVIAELLWFLRGETNVRSLQREGVHIWDKWADENGDLGPVYGAQWRKRRHHTHEKITEIDQIANLLKGLREDPYSRRHMVDSWNVGELSQMALPPCHCLFQFYVGSDERLHLQLYQRSADLFLGVPFNIASYAALLVLIATMIGREPGEFIHTFGDVHLYGNTFDQAKEQLKREPTSLPFMYIHPPIKGTGVEVFNELTVADFELVDYRPHATIKAEVKR